jgi:hypothetical protein
MDKTLTLNRSINSLPVKTDIYQKVGGSYVFLSAYTGTSRMPLKDVLSRQWDNFNAPPSWIAFKKANGYLPTQEITELREYWNQLDIPVVVYFYDGMAYRTENKTIDPLYIPAASGLVDSGTFGWFTSTQKGTLQIDCQQKTLDKARNMKVNVPVMLAEGRLTVRMLADTLQTLGRAYRNFRRGRFRQAAETLGIPTPSKTASNHWLAYQYGWMPLISDAKGLSHVAEKGLIDPARGPRFRVASETLMYQDFDFTQNQGASFWTGGLTRYRGQDVVVAKTGLLLEFTPNASGFNSVGMGTFDPLLVAWELTPFSFVFDWFVDVGSYLENLSSLQDVTVLAGWTSYIEHHFGVATMERPSPSGKIDGLKPSASWSHRYYRRSPWSGQVSLRTPLWDALKARRITTLGALWRQRTRGDRVPGRYLP